MNSVLFQYNLKGLGIREVSRTECISFTRRVTRSSAAGSSWHFVGCLARQVFTKVPTQLKMPSDALPRPQRRPVNLVTPPRKHGDAAKSLQCISYGAPVYDASSDHFGCFGTVVKSDKDLPRSAPQAGACCTMPSLSRPADTSSNPVLWARTLERRYITI